MDLSVTAANKIIATFLVPVVNRNLGLSLTETQVNQFGLYLTELIKWGKVINLTAITELKEIVGKHFYDSLTLCNLITLFPGCRVMDLGTGAGFPGIPLKICFPEIDLTLVESQRKKTVFLELLVKQLKLTKLEIVTSRIENLLNQNKYRNHYDFILARAVTKLDTIIKFGLPLLKVSGMLVLYTGRKIYCELTRLETLLSQYDGKVASVNNFETEFNGLQLTRTLVLIQRTIPK